MDTATRMLRMGHHRSSWAKTGLESVRSGLIGDGIDEATLGKGNPSIQTGRTLPAVQARSLIAAPGEFERYAECLTSSYDIRFVPVHKGGQYGDRLEVTQLGRTIHGGDKWWLAIGIRGVSSGMGTEGNRRELQRDGPTGSDREHDHVPIRHHRDGNRRRGIFAMGYRNR